MKDSPYFDANVAAAYAQLAVPLQFAAPAKDLVASLHLPAGGSVLDVGAGTGAATVPAAAAVGPLGLAVGVDRSIEMLRWLQRTRPCRVVAAEMPGLPFRDGLFDAVSANFVLSHCQVYERALADIMRVLRPGGRVGVTTWDVTPVAPAQVWNDIVRMFLDFDDFTRAFKAQIPWDQWLAQETNFRRVLTDAGFTNVAVSRRPYLMRMSVADYLRLREAGVEGALVRRRLGTAQWEALRRRLAEAFRSRFAETIEYTREVYLGVGIKQALENAG